MKLFYKYAFLFIISFVGTVSFSSCGGNDGDGSSNNNSTPTNGDSSEEEPYSFCAWYFTPADSVYECSDGEVRNKSDQESGGYDYTSLPYYNRAIQIVDDNTLYYYEKLCTNSKGADNASMSVSTPRGTLYYKSKTAYVYQVVNNVLYVTTAGDMYSIKDKTLVKSGSSDVYTNCGNRANTSNQNGSYTVIRDVSGIIDGHEYVDLGLPSGTLWATMNVGATSDSERGLFFAWGETTGYSESENHDFSYDNYKYKDDAKQYSKYTGTGTYYPFGYSVYETPIAGDGLTELQPSDDAATVAWGSKWQMPSIEQVQELSEEIDKTLTLEFNSVRNGKTVRVVLISKKNGNKLYLAFSGFYANKTMELNDEYSFLWTRSLSYIKDNSKRCWGPIICGNGGDAFPEGSFDGVGGIWRYCGLNIRPVVKK